MNFCGLPQATWFPDAALKEVFFRQVRKQGGVDYCFKPESAACAGMTKLTGICLYGFVMESDKYQNRGSGGILLYRILQAFALILLLVVAIGAGFIAGTVATSQGLIPMTGFSAGSGEGSADTLDVELLRQADNTIRNNYADRETLEGTNLTYSAIGGMVDSLGDTGHSRFLTPEMVRAERQAIQGEYEGIGALLNVNEAGNPVILAPMDGSPAQNAGLRAGDIILEVDGHDVSQAELTEVVQRVMGPAGTDVTLTLRRPEDDQIRDVTITRARIEVQNVTWQMLPETDIALVRIAAFSQNVSNDLVRALEEAQAQGARGIILDLRNNPGGLLNESISVVSQFIAEGNALQIRDAQGRTRSIPVQRGGAATQIPMVALINEGSASAAEITAGALQDYNRATLVGQKTFGTGTVLNQFRLSDGSALLLATELWLTPEGRAIWHEGIAPDVEVELPVDTTPTIPTGLREATAEDIRNLDDTQLLRALELMQEQIAVTQP
jgi:carboxyl-terminal processing protease